MLAILRFEPNTTKVMWSFRRVSSGGRNKTCPDNRTGAPTNDLDYWQQSTFSIGMVSTLPVFVDNDEFDLNRDRWVIMTADQTLTGTRDGSGALPYVADLQDSRSTSEITSNQLTALNRGDMLRVDTWPTRYWARMVNSAVPNVPDAPAAQTEARNYNLQISTGGVASGNRTLAEAERIRARQMFKVIGAKRIQLPMHSF